MAARVSVRLAEEDVPALDALIAVGTFKTRSDALRTALAALLHEQRGYGKYPQEEWIGRDGLAALEAFHLAEGGDPL